jgi:hypothetical protein
MRKNILALGIACAVCLLFLECVSTSPLFYDNNSVKDFTILGEVTYESAGRVGFQDLLKAAKKKYAECDYVVDVMVDKKSSAFFGTTNTFIMRGSAIQYK